MFSFFSLQFQIPSNTLRVHALKKLFIKCSLQFQIVKYRQNACVRDIVFNTVSEVIRVVSNSVRLHALPCFQNYLCNCYDVVWWYRITKTSESPQRSLWRAYNLCRIRYDCLKLGITPTIAIAIDPRHVYNVICKGANNKIVAQKKMIVSLLFVLKF